MDDPKKDTPCEPKVTMNVGTMEWTRILNQLNEFYDKNPRAIQEENQAIGDMFAIVSDGYVPDRP